MPSRDDATDTTAAGELRSVTTFDPDAGERASNAVITAVATLLDASPVELDPLYEAIEPDALDSLVDHARRINDAGTHQLQFVYEGFDVGVQTDGRIRIHDAPVTASSNGA
ncbi:HalOD1 output domain-containing protein [Natronorubrum thiooxidans]|uniref:Halobacterial output domain-containing protein n=1 Tax=Natronorubrum thiooxidans TaxID=308853 RepID=A0A1N7ETL7_9EURY|nr:HalOD1 output domain-containing protein [Natronorubrum thiooxidans]SIR91430.1 hypothetical protein SAMN05421752_10546 [Natronorubrum thiooxidans]